MIIYNVLTGTLVTEEARQAVTVIGRHAWAGHADTAIFTDESTQAPSHRARSVRRTNVLPAIVAVTRVGVCKPMKTHMWRKRYKG